MSWNLAFVFAVKVLSLNMGWGTQTAVNSPHWTPEASWGPQGPGLTPGMGCQAQPTAHPEHRPPSLPAAPLPLITARPPPHNLSILHRPRPCSQAAGEQPLLTSTPDRPWRPPPPTRSIQELCPNPRLASAAQSVSHISHVACRCDGPRLGGAAREGLDSALARCSGRSCARRDFCSCDQDSPARTPQP